MLNMNMMTLQERVHRRSGHVAVSYRETLLVWGGFMEGHSDVDEDTPANTPTQDQCSYHYTDEIWVYHHDTELWQRLLTSGDIPPPTCGSCGVVLGRSMFVFGGFCHGGNQFGNTNQLYRLDLTTLRWHLLTPGGQPPAPCDKLAGWTHGDKVYFFGGFGPRPNYHPSFSFVVDPTTTQSADPRGWNNQLVAYDPVRDTWVWPKIAGEAPCPRAAHAADITGDRVYIFGGRYMVSRRHDLICLDLAAMRWTLMGLTSAGHPSQVPVGRSWHSLTFLTPDRAILYGGLNNHNVILNDCWVLDLAARSWTEVKLRYDHGEPRCWHGACRSPTGQLVVHSGVTQPYYETEMKLKDHAEELLVLDFTPKALFRLSMDAVLKTLPVNRWFETGLIPKDIENILVLRLEQNPSMSLL